MGCVPGNQDRKARSFLLAVGLCCLRSIGLVFVLMVGIWFGLFCLRLEFGLVFVAYGSSRLGIGFGLFCLRFPHCK